MRGKLLFSEENNKTCLPDIISAVQLAFPSVQYCSEQNRLQEFAVPQLTWGKKKDFFWTKNAKETGHYGLTQWIHL